MGQDFDKEFWINRAAEVVANEGWGELFDSEISAIRSNRGWREAVEARVTELNGRSGVRAPEWIVAPPSPTSNEQQSRDVIQAADVVLQATLVYFGSGATDGQIVEAVAPPWFEILRHVEKDPEFLFRIPWRTLEEIIAGAYTRAGWPEVILTPRSGDGGRDIIATKPGVLSVRVFDQIKAYRKGHVVTADEIRSMLGVLTANANVSKGLVTTTSRFAPGIERDVRLRAFIPYRLELKDGDELRRWLLALRPEL